MRTHQGGARLLDQRDAVAERRDAVADTALLDTLSEREFKAGYAEVVKYGLIDNPDFFDWCEANWSRVIAGGPVRAVVEAVGIPNVLTKCIGSNNPHNVVKATIVALEQLRDKSAVADLRGLPVEKI